MGQVAVKTVYTKGARWVDELLEYLTGNMEYMRTFVKENFPKAHFVEPEGTYLTWVDRYPPALASPMKSSSI